MSFLRQSQTTVNVQLGIKLYILLVKEDLELNILAHNAQFCRRMVYAKTVMPYAAKFIIRLNIEKENKRLLSRVRRCQSLLGHRTAYRIGFHGSPTRE
jgi:hypothetical protein